MRVKMRNSLNLLLLASVYILLLRVETTQGAFSTLRGSGWKSFLLKHVPDEAGDPLDVDYDSWGKIEWNEFLRRRLGPRVYGVKYENTIVSSGRIDLQADFLGSGPHQTYAKNNGETMHWSNGIYTVYHFTLDKYAPVQKYNGVICLNKYVLTRLDCTSNLPFHFEGFLNAPVPNHANFRRYAGCTRIQ